MSLFDIDQIPLACPDCGEPIEDTTDLRPDGCVNCYVNDDCPGQCNDVHDAPEPDSDGVWQCPTTSDWYAYTGPARALHRGTWEESSSYTVRIRYDDYWYEDHEDAGLYYCESCDAYEGEDHYHDYDDEDNDVDRDDDVDPVCISCGSSAITHYHLISEATYCDEHHTNMAAENRCLIPTRELVAA